MTNLICLILLASLSCTRRQEPLPVLGNVPAFSLTTSDGSTKTEADFKGKVWVADFIYTQCPGICPMLSSQMARLQHDLDQAGLFDVGLASFSVDPAHDTPEVMRAYAQHLHPDPKRWWFLTGERDALYALIGKGFLLAVADRKPEEAGDSEDLVTHSDRFVLVDRALQIRGYYRPLEEGVASTLLADLKRLHAGS